MAVKNRFQFFAINLLLTLVFFNSCTIIKAGSYASQVFIQERDPELAKAALPTMMKASEAIYFADKKNHGNAVMTAQLYVMYANAFLENEAFLLDDEEYEEKARLTKRANALYLRAVDILLPVIEEKAKHSFLSDIDISHKALNTFKAKDIPLLYWTSAAILSAFSSNPMDFNTATKVSLALSLFERAYAIDPDWNNGSLYELAITVYAALPKDLGGNIEKAKQAYELAMLKTGGKSASVLFAYAKNISTLEGSRAEFEKSLQQAARLPVRQDSALTDVLASQKAARLLEDIDLYF